MFLELLLEFHFKVFRKTSDIIPTPQEGRQGPSDLPAKTTVQCTLPRPGQVQSIGTKTASTEQTICRNNRRQSYGSWVSDPH